MRPLGDVSVIVKTFLRDGLMEKCVRSLQEAHPEVELVIVDDGWESAPKDQFYASTGADIVKLPFDSGYGAKANAGLPHCTRRYLLAANDDFVFGPGDGLSDLAEVLDQVPEAGIAAGRVDGHPYECYLEYGDGWIREVPFPEDGPYTTLPTGQQYALVDLTSVYMLVRRDLLGEGKVLWEAGFPIGVEHLDFHEDMAAAGWDTAFVRGVNIAQFPPGDMHDTHPSYQMHRMRPGMGEFFAAKHKIHTYYRMNGLVDTFT